MNYNCVFLFLLLLFFSSCLSINDIEEEKHAFTNELVNESSPYLLQHAHNPVNWIPWGEKAFEKAKNEDKLVLVSVGYSSCHWCHVMEEESFEDIEIANIMNENFVCIKVDREERPDVDQNYMTAVQLTTGSGGWPLNCFTLPDGRPVYGGTYFQKEEWKQILENLAYTYQKDKNKFIQFAENLSMGIKETNLIELPKTEIEFSSTYIQQMVDSFKLDFDWKNGGFNRVPKFPLPNNLEFLMVYANLFKDDSILKFVEFTLEKMTKGGIYDQIGGGFSRYSTDEKWKVPHFEKMLYDNAQLVSVYSHAYQSTKNDIFKNTVYQTLLWIYSEMRNENGGFYSAIDADSEGEEGKFYTWAEDELKIILNETEWKEFNQYYEMNENGLWDEKYILIRKEKGIYSNEIKKINQKLYQEREKRISPMIDDKSLTSWNALTIKSFTDAYLVFNEPLFLQAAIVNGNWLIKNQLQNNGKLLRTYKNNESKIDGFLEDYAYTIEAFIRLYEASFDEKWLRYAEKLTVYTIENFYDEQTGLFYYSEVDASSIIQRNIEINDNVMPASNSVMAHNLFKLGVLQNNNTYQEMAVKMLKLVYSDIINYPSSYSNWAILSMFITHPYFEIAISGENWQEKHAAFSDYYIPNKILMGGLNSSLELMQGKTSLEGIYYVCFNKACQKPVTNIEEVVEQINQLRFNP